MRRGVRAILFAAGILIAYAGTAHAQAIGSIFGKVSDSTGAVLPGVTVTVTGTGLQQPLVGTTSSDGAYQFPSVPIGTYSVTFELQSFKKAVRENVVINNGFNAQIDQKLEVGQMTEQMTVSAAAPVVDTKKVATSAVFTSQTMENIPTARDPWTIINMAPGVQGGLNVGGSASGQQVSLASRGTASNVQWNLEGGSITDLSSNSSPTYFDFDSIDQIQVTNGGGDVSIQSSGLSINIITKSGSNVFKGTAHGTFENSSMQGQNISQAQFNAGSVGGAFTGNPIHKIDVLDGDYGGPILKNKLWFWGSADRQKINAGIANFFDPTKGTLCQNLVAAQNAKQLTGNANLTYSNLGAIQGCLGNDLTSIKDYDWKLNYQINASNKIQWLFTSDNKYRNHRGSSATTAIEATTQQTSDAPWDFPLPTHSFTHTWIANDRLVFNNQVTYVGGGFFLDYQDVPPQGTCSQSRYNGSTTEAGYDTDPTCQFNIQALNNRTTGLNSRSLTDSYQTVRHTWEAKTDGTYFLSNKLGGDHSLKFGVGYRKAPILTFSHYSGGAKAFVQCVGNLITDCGNGAAVVPGSAAAALGGIVPYEARLYRDDLYNTDWWTYNGYIQDSYSRGKVRLNGGVRYDWQQSKTLGGCVPANPMDPTAIPSQCESGTSVDPNTGAKLKPFQNWSPRVSATYDVFGNGKTSVHGSFSYYYQTKITLANQLTGIDQAAYLTWGPNSSSGKCTGTSCWQDLNGDGIVQMNELTGTPTPSSSAFGSTGILLPVGNSIDPNAQIARTREAVVGVQHEVMPNFAVGVDYIYRKYDNGTTTYTIGYTPGSANGTLANLYTGPFTFTDTTPGPGYGISAPYYQICQGCLVPQGIGSIAETNPNYQVYQGVDVTLTKRFSNRWQANGGLTVQTNPQYYPATSSTYQNPTGQQFVNGFFNTSITDSSRYIFKASGSYVFPWDINVAANYNLIDGQIRVESINGPGQVYGGANNFSLSYSTLTFNNAGTNRYPKTSVLDLSASKSFKFRGGKDSVKAMIDCFNALNTNVPYYNSGQGINPYVSSDLDSAGFTQLSSIVPPRVFRVGFGLTF